MPQEAGDVPRRVPTATTVLDASATTAWHALRGDARALHVGSGVAIRVDATRAGAICAAALRAADAAELGLTRSEFGFGVVARVLSGGDDAARPSSVRLLLGAAAGDAAVRLCVSVRRHEVAVELWRGAEAERIAARPTVDADDDAGVWPAAAAAGAFEVCVRGSVADGTLSVSVNDVWLLSDVRIGAAWSEAPLCIGLDVGDAEAIALSHLVVARHDGCTRRPLDCSPSELQSLASFVGRHDSAPPCKPFGMGATRSALRCALIRALHVGHAPSRGPVLLYGVPGSGKTLLARSDLAGEDVRVLRFSMHELLFRSLQFPVSRVFELARYHAPCVLCIDDFDQISAGESRSGVSRQLALVKLVNKFMAEQASTQDPFARGAVLLISSVPWALDDAVLSLCRTRIRTPTLDAPSCSALIRSTIGSSAESPFDFEAAGHLCAGLTGADIVTALRDAAMAPLRRAMPLSTAQLAAMQKSADQSLVQVQEADVFAALQAMRSSVSANLARLDEWERGWKDGDDGDADAR